MNRFRTGQGAFVHSLHKWGLAQSPSCECRHVPITQFEGGLNLLHEVYDVTVI